MNGMHPDLGELGPELRKLAQAVLDGIDPAVRAAAARASTDRPGKCQQVWCPVCALAAVVSGEEHPLLTVIAEHSVALLAVIRAVLDDQRGAHEPAAPAPSVPSTGGGTGETNGAAAKNGYQHIPVDIEE
ncbi:MAG TPA: hypothetical protein VFR17_06455 [Mycobacterium sp.]|nr:hypothetical protein [Mycobacterium sp.]